MKRLEFKFNRFFIFIMYMNLKKVDKSTGTISVRNPNGPSDEPPKLYTFDHVFGDDAKQLDIYNLIARPIVEAVLEGYNGKRAVIFYVIAWPKYGKQNI